MHGTERIKNGSREILPGLMIPGLFAKFAFAPKSFCQLDLRIGMFGHQDSHHVEAVLHFANTEDLAIDFRRSRDLPLFSKIDVRYYGCEFVRATRFDFDKAERFAIQSDQIDLARYLNTFAVPSDWDLEICDDKAITVGGKEFGGESFAAKPEFACPERGRTFILLNDR